MKKKLLIFCYYWPPAGGVAVQRVLKLVKYLPLFGWEPVIITVKDGSYQNRDEALLKEVPETVRVYRTETREPFSIYNLLRGRRGKAVSIAHVDSNSKNLFQRISAYVRANFFLPDARVGWVPYAFREAARIIEQEKIDAFFITSPPHSSQLIGLELKKRYQIPWLADFRDPWTKIFLNEFLPRTKWAKRKDQELEQRVLQSADAITVIGEGMKEDFREHAHKITVLPNGFDEADFQNNAIEDSTHFTLRYVGNLLSSENVPALWQSIRELRAEDQAFRHRFRLQVIGHAGADVQEALQAHQLEDCVQYIGFQPHTEAIRWMKGATALLLVIPQVRDNHAIITGKLFEYLATQRPIFSIGPTNGNAAAILTETERSRMMHYQDTRAIKSQLRNLWGQWQQAPQTLTHTNHLHLRYSRKTQAQQLALLLDRLSA